MKASQLASTACSLAITVALGASTATAGDLIAYDGFEYGPTPNLQFADGGDGWNSAWNKLSSIPTGVAFGGLEYPGLQVSGNTAWTAPYPSADYTRYSRAIAPYSSPDDTVYLSFLFTPGVGHGLGGGLAFGSWDNGMVVGVNPYSGHYGLAEPNGASSSDSSVPMVEGETALVVAKVHRNVRAGTVSWSAAINPSVTGAEPAEFAANLTIPGTALPPAVFVYNDGGFGTDEIRVGLTWASVLPPATAPCPADLDANGSVDGGDLAQLLGTWGAAGPADLDGDGIVGGADMAILLGAWGACP